MVNAKCVIYVKNAKNAIFDAHAIQLISCIDMAIDLDWTVELGLEFDKTPCPTWTGLLSLDWS